MIELIGIEALRRLTSTQLAQVTDMAVGQAVHEEAQLMFAVSQRRVPVDTGTLRRSGMITPPHKEAGNWTVVLGYGGAASEYALAQHERADYRHKNGHTWKYLEGPVRERIPNLEARLARRITRILTGV